MGVQFSLRPWKELTAIINGMSILSALYKEGPRATWESSSNAVGFPSHFLSLLLFLSSPGLFLIDLMQVLHNRSAWSLDGYGKTNSGDCFMWQMSEAVKPSWGTQEASQNTHKSSCMFPGICKATRMSKPVPRPRKNLGGPQSRQLTLECWRCAPNSKHTYHLRKSSLFICPLP